MGAKLAYKMENDVAAESNSEPSSDDIFQGSEVLKFTLQYGTERYC